MERDDNSIISRHIIWKKFIRLRAEGYTPRAVEVKQTPEGLERREVHVLPVAACGRVISEGEISGICSVCHCFECSLHFFLCGALPDQEEGCRRSLCILHAHFLRTETTIVPYCGKCYERVALNQDTWRLLRFEDDNQ